ncbi:TolB family protein [Arthrobacter agilis]|uniref:TolB family protein n=1 Tax=Arthrobacter agilis TaxID=37921 RepID=UPI00278A7CA7|nr:biopolymer transporter Tol [Arthrobacter agilis]MDQ0736263.1 TolB protein [Arthrobacter agilis]
MSTPLENVARPVRAAAAQTRAMHGRTTVDRNSSTTHSRPDRTGDPRWRRLLPGQRSRLMVFDIATRSSACVFETEDFIIEAPNWTPDGGGLLFNCDGLLYRTAPREDSQPRVVFTGAVTDSNNDHVVSADGRFLYLSSQDGHLYRVPLDGGEALRVTRPDDGLEARYLHGISPDGGTLVHIGCRRRQGRMSFDIYAVDVEDGATRRLTDSDRPHDGVEYSPDGQWLYFNSERASEVPGHSQLFRMRTDGTDPEQLTADERVNWFPHPAPDGASLVYLSYAPGVQGHPANEPVLLRVADPDGRNAWDAVELFGGQGTLNVNSWAPDSRRFAYVDYPLEDE